MNRDIRSMIKEVNRFSLPLVANQLLNMVLTTVLAAIVGRISMEGIAIAEVVDQFFYALIGIVGVGVVVFNIESSKVRLVDDKDFLNWFRSCSEVNFLLGIVAVFSTWFFAKPLLFHLYHFEDAILFLSVRYARIFSLTVFAWLLIFSFSNLLKVKKKTKEIFFCGLLSGAVQLLLSYGLVFHYFTENDRILGVAIGSTIAVFVQLGCYLFLIRKDIVDSFSIVATYRKKLLQKSVPFILQEILEGSIFSVLVIALITRRGTHIIASYGVDMKLVEFCLVPMYMYCQSLMVLIGEN